VNVGFCCNAEASGDHFGRPLGRVGTNVGIDPRNPPVSGAKFESCRAHQRAFERMISLKYLAKNSFSARTVTHYCAAMDDDELAKPPMPWRRLNEVSRGNARSFMRGETSPVRSRLGNSKSFVAAKSKGWFAIGGMSEGDRRLNGCQTLTLRTSPAWRASSGAPASRPRRSTTTGRTWSTPTIDISRPCGRFAGAVGPPLVPTELPSADGSFSRGVCKKIWRREPVVTDDWESVSNKGDRQNAQ